MRITDAYTKLAEQTSTSTAKASDAKVQAAKVNEQAAAATKATSNDAVQVNVSSKARELAASSADVASQIKVTQLKAAIDDGSFKVDAKLIAERLVNGG